MDSTGESSIHPVLSLAAAVFWVICEYIQCTVLDGVLMSHVRAVWLLSWAKSLVAFVTISLPRFIYAALSYSLTFTVRFVMPPRLILLLIAKFIQAKLLVVRRDIRASCSRPQLFHTFPLFECIYDFEGAAACKIGCEGTSS